MFSICFLLLQITADEDLEDWAAGPDEEGGGGDAGGAASGALDDALVSERLEQFENMRCKGVKEVLRKVVMQEVQPVGHWMML